MASLSDQIDRFARHTRAIATSLSLTAKSESTSSDFTQAVLYTHLGDLIRDIDPSELGLFTLVENTLTPYDKDPRLAQDPSITRAHFPGATPLRRRPTSQDPNLEIEPEIYAHAALKYIEQYEPIRAMPRAYERIVSILNRLEDIRKTIAQLNLTLKQVSRTEELRPIKTLLETEESSIKDLQSRITYLSKKKQTTLKPERVKPTRPKLQSPALRKNDIISLPSPQEDQFWSKKGEMGRTLCFTDNLMDEESNLADVSIDCPGMELGHLSKSMPFDEGNSFIQERTIIQTGLVKIAPEVKGESPTLEMPSSKGSSPAAGRSATPSALASSLSPASSAASNPPPTVNHDPSKSEEMPRQHRIKVNREVEKIVAKIWLILGDTIPLPNSSVAESISYLQNLASQIPQLESPVASSASSVSIETNTAPTAQQVLTASLLTMLLASNSNYSLPLNQVKENLTLKAKTAGMSVVGQGTTRVLYGCVAKRLVKVDRGGREQVVKFDI